MRFWPCSRTIHNGLICQDQFTATPKFIQSYTEEALSTVAALKNYSSPWKHQCTKLCPSLPTCSPVLSNVPTAPMSLLLLPKAVPDGILLNMFFAVTE